MRCRRLHYQGLFLGSGANNASKLQYRETRYTNISPVFYPRGNFYILMEQLVGGGEEMREMFHAFI